MWELAYAPTLGHPARLTGLEEVMRHVNWFRGAVENFRFFDIRLYAFADPQGAVAEWVLDFTAVVSGTQDIGFVDWQRSTWQVIRRHAVHSGGEGSLRDLNSAVTTFCEVVNGKGGVVVR